MFLQSYIFSFQILVSEAIIVIVDFETIDDIMILEDMSDDFKEHIKLPGARLIKSKFAPGNVCNYKL